jgi:hypothetical protein
VIIVVRRRTGSVAGAPHRSDEQKINLRIGIVLGAILALALYLLYRAFVFFM